MLGCAAESLVTYWVPKSNLRCGELMLVEIPMQADFG